MKKMIIPVFALTLFGLLVFCADTNTLPFPLNRVYDIPFGDKIGHLLIMGIVSFAVINPIRRSVGKTVFTAAAAAALLVLFTGEEISQIFNPNRTFSLADLACSYGGVFWGTLLALRTGSLKTIQTKR